MGTSHEGSSASRETPVLGTGIGYLHNPENCTTQKTVACQKVGMELGNASANAKAASETAVIVASARAEDFAKYFLTFLRETNDTFEDWDVEFRAMRVLYGLENYTNHQNNDHTLCAKWLWWTKCALGAKYDVPDLHYLTQVCVFL
jgi:hypothetical protein